MLNRRLLDSLSTTPKEFKRRAIRETAIDAMLEGVKRNTLILKAAIKVRHQPWSVWAQVLCEGNPEFTDKVRKLYILKEGTVDHAKRELMLAGMFDKEVDGSEAAGGWNILCAEAVVELMEVFAEQGHSGFSASMTRELFNRLSNFEVLTELTDNSEEWNDVSEYSGNNPMWQSQRCPASFSTDAGKTYYNLDDDKWNEDGSRVTTAAKHFSSDESLSGIDEQEEEHVDKGIYKSYQASDHKPGWRVKWSEGGKTRHSGCYTNKDEAIEFAKKKGVYEESKNEAVGGPGKREIEVKNTDRGTGVLDTFVASPQQRAGWQMVTYKGKSYRLAGGIKGNEFINISNPIKGKTDEGESDMEEATDGPGLHDPREDEEEKPNGFKDMDKKAEKLAKKAKKKQKKDGK